MYQIKPYDCSEFFTRIPSKKKYSFTFYQQNSISFVSKREAFKFSSDISQLFTEALAICEMVANTVHSFSFQIRPKSAHVQDSYNIYHNNNVEISQLIRDLKHPKYSNIELYQIYKKFDNLIYLIIHNCKILNKKNYNCVLPYLIIIQKTAKSLFGIIDKISEKYQPNNLSLFLSK